MAINISTLEDQLEELVTNIGIIEYERVLYRDTITHILNGMKENEGGEITLQLTPEGGKVMEKAVNRIEESK